MIRTMDYRKNGRRKGRYVTTSSAPPTEDDGALSGEALNGRSRSYRDSESACLSMEIVNCTIARNTAQIGRRRW